MNRLTAIVVATIMATSAHANGPYEPPPNPGYVVNNTNQNANWNQNTNQQAQSQQQKQLQSQGQAQGQSQSANNRNSVNNNVSVNNSTRAAASSAIAGNVAGCMEGMSASMQTFGWGVGVAKCRGDYYNQVVDAEERAKRGDRAGAIYLSTRDNGAHAAFRAQGVIETTADRRARVGVPARPSCPASDPILKQHPRTGAYTCHRR